MTDFLDQVYYNNTVRQYFITLSVIIGGLLLTLLIRKLIITRLRRWTSTTEGTWDDFLITSIRRFGVPILRWLAIYWGLHILTLSEKAAFYIAVITSVVITYYVLRLISSMMLMLLKAELRRREHGEEKLKQLGGLIMVFNIVIWFVGLVFLLSNWGVEVTPIIAGLGIGGIAVALAAQNILSDLFSYFAIFFDRPFEAGDFIIVDDMLGSIEYVGIKTTHIRSLGGEQIIIGNGALTNSRIRNYKRMYRRRVVFGINVEYGTPKQLVEKIPGMLRSIVEQQENVTFDRAHFAAYNDWSLRFEIVYYVQSPDYNVYMDIQQKINFQILEGFETNGIRFAIPTQSLHVRANVEGTALQK